MTRSAQLATLAAAALALHGAGSARAQMCAGNRHCWHVGATHANCCYEEEPPRYEDRVPACARDLAREAAGLPAGPSGSCDPSALAVSCDQGDPLACEELGHLAAERGASDAVTFFERACAGGRLHGCGAGGLLALRGARTEEERRRAEAMLWFACSPPHDPAGADPSRASTGPRPSRRAAPTTSWRGTHGRRRSSAGARAAWRAPARAPPSSSGEAIRASDGIARAPPSCGPARARSASRARARRSPRAGRGDARREPRGAPGRRAGGGEPRRGPRMNPRPSAASA
ncbi:MAG: hypothetical protein M5U28_13100 [Sandaracinaceae bacterium]|nr:hypothetical protein [Sandaracinaceae bacterium]